MSLLSSRPTYKPFMYNKAYTYWETQQQAHWLHTEISMASDLNDYKTLLTPNEKNVIGQILKGFTQSEIFIGDYWSNRVAKWFKHPEIQMMANTFAAFESIHAVSYAYLNDTLGLDDYSAFLHDKTTKAKIDRLIATPGKSLEDIALSLAVFSAFNEGVNLFSSFAVLMNFQRYNKMKGLGQIIAFSVRDESLHSDAGCWLFRTLIEENPDLWTDDFKRKLYDAARLTVELEDAFIDKVFELGDIEGLTKDEMKSYIRYRANTKLQDIGLKSNWKNVNKDHIKSMEWFEYIVSGVEHQDFFAGRVTSYAKGSLDWSKIFN